MSRNIQDKPVRECGWALQLGGYELPNPSCADHKNTRVRTMIQIAPNGFFQNSPHLSFSSLLSWPFVSRTATSLIAMKALRKVRRVRIPLWRPGAGSGICSGFHAWFRSGARRLMIRNWWHSLSIQARFALLIQMGLIAVLVPARHWLLSGFEEKSGSPQEAVRWRPLTASSMA